MPHVCIIGGGIAGLSTAWYLQQIAEAGGYPLRVTIFDADQRLGGKIATHDEDGFVIEGGPDSFLTQKTWGQRLCTDLGLADELQPMLPRPVYVLRHGKLQQFPLGFRLAIPTKWMPMLRTPLFSWRAKLRMALEPFIKVRAESTDESLASFIRRRLGDEAVEVIGGPLMAGIHSADPETLSIAATFPNFIELERQHGSLIRGMRAAARQSPRKSAVFSASNLQSPFLSLNGGMVRLVEALCEHLDADLRPATPVKSISRNDQGFTLHLAHETVQADAVVLALPGFAAAPLVDELDPELAAALHAIEYVSTATVSLGFREADLEGKCQFDGIGFVVADHEDTQIQACTFSSRKFNKRCPPGHVLVRVFIGGHRHQELVDLPDPALYELAREALEDLLGIDAQPVLKRIFRWPNANPQYTVGHLERVTAMEARAARFHGLHLTGSAFRGIGIPACIGNAYDTAVQIATACGWPVPDPDASRPRPPSERPSSSPGDIADHEVASTFAAAAAARRSPVPASPETATTEVEATTASDSMHDEAPSQSPVSPANGNT